MAYCFILSISAVAHMKLLMERQSPSCCHQVLLSGAEISLCSSDSNRSMFRLFPELKRNVYQFKRELKIQHAKLKFLTVWYIQRREYLQERTFQIRKSNRHRQKQQVKAFDSTVLSWQQSYQFFGVYLLTHVPIEVNNLQSSQMFHNNFMKCNIFIVNHTVFRCHCMIDIWTRAGGPVLAVQ